MVFVFTFAEIKPRLEEYQSEYMEEHSIHVVRVSQVTHSVDKSVHVFKVNQSNDTDTMVFAYRLGDRDRYVLRVPTESELDFLHEDAYNYYRSLDVHNSLVRSKRTRLELRDWL